MANTDNYTRNQRGKNAFLARHPYLVPLGGFASFGLVVALLVMVHNMGRMEGKLESLQNSLNVQQQMTLTAQQQLLQYSINERHTEANILKKTADLAKNIERNIPENVSNNHKAENLQKNSGYALNSAEKIAKDTVNLQKSVQNDKNISDSIAKKVKRVDFKASLPQNGLRGKVLVVQPRQKRVMINLGEKLNITAGKRFVLWRKGTYVGEIEVKNVFSDMAACEIVSIAGSGIYVGDQAHEVPIEVADASVAGENATFHITNNFSR